MPFFTLLDIFVCSVNGIAIQIYHLRTTKNFISNTVKKKMPTVFTSKTYLVSTVVCYRG